MLYNDIVQKLYSINKKGSRFNLECIKKLLLNLNIPFHKLPAIHIAGTNGKGSTSTKIAAALQETGFRVGLYTSPHIATFRERIKVNNEIISKEDVELLFPPILETYERLKIDETFFEYITALAFSYFAKKEVDFIVLETGLGGRLDATNICSPILTVITSISLDHTSILGNTIEEIAKEKAGILKPGIPVVIGPKVPLNYILPKIEECSSPFFQVTERGLHFEDENREIARKALEVLSKKISFSTQAIEKGLIALPPCRFEIVSEEQLITNFGTNIPHKVILDVGHNPDGIDRLIQRLKLTFGDHPATVIYGASKDKDFQSCITLLADYAKQLVFVEAESERAATVSELLKLIKNQPSKPYNSLLDGIKNAFFDAAKKKNILVITGTFFIMQKARKFLGFNDEEDFYVLHDKISKEY